MTEKKVRGSVINGYLKFVEKTKGKDGLDKCLADTNLKGLDIKDGVLQPYGMLQHVIKWISVHYGIEGVRKAGRYTVKNLGMMAYLVRFTKIETMLGRAKEAYREAYHFGHVEMNIEGKKAVATMSDVSEMRENCEGWIGALEALLELTNTRGIVKKTGCQLDGGDACTYEISWE